jgi:xanthine dehydrogenase accessory factor
VQFDVSDAQLTKLHGPIGIFIDRKISSEIAVSILTEMTAVKNGVMLEAYGRIDNAMRSTQPEVTTAV